MTAPSVQNGLRQLEAKIKGLPVQDALLRRRQLFRGAQEEARQRRADLQAALDQVKALRVIQANPTLMTESEQRRLAAARAKALELLDLVGEADPESVRFGEKFEAIKRASRALSEEVKTNWAHICQDHHDRANALRPLAERLSPSLALRLQDLDRLMRIGTTSPPTTVEALQAIVNARTALAAEIASLDMDGPIETFLRDAQTGRGDPKALFDPQVREYLEAHPALWKSLRVVLS